MIESPWRDEGVLESFTVAIFILDEAWCFSYVNPVAEKALKHEASDLVGRRFWDAFPEVADTIFDREFRRAVSENVAVGFEGFYEPLDLWVQVYAYPTEDQLTVIFRDINDRKRAERSAKRLEARNRAIVQALPDDIYMISKSGIIVEAETGGVSGTRSLESILGCSIDDVFPPEVARRYRDAIQYVQETGEMRVLSYTLPAPSLLSRTDRHDASTQDASSPGASPSDDSRPGVSRTNVSPSNEEHGEEGGGQESSIEARVVPVEGNGVLAIVRDVTTQRSLERQVLQVTKRERERIGRDLHDGLASLLSGISLMSKTLERNIRDGREVSAESLQEISRLAKDGVEQARALSRGLNPVDVAPGKFIESLREMVANAQMVSGKTCYMDAPDSVEVLKSEVATQLYWIAQEAVTNAIRHSRGDRIAVGVWHDTDHLVLSVRDNGIGLDHDNGMGQRTMRYRAHMIGATFRIRDRASDPEGGRPTGRHPEAPSTGVEVICRMPIWKAIPATVDSPT